MRTLAVFMLSRSAEPSLVLGLAAGLFVAASTSATTLTYQSQTGSVAASGNTDTLPPASQSFPISGLSDVNQVAFVANSDASSFYSARAQLQTTLGTDQLQIVGDTMAHGSFMQFTSGADAGAMVTVLFSLDAPATVQVRGSQTAGRHNGATVKLQSLDLGFVFSLDPFGALTLNSCGTLSPAECNQLPIAFFSEGLFPAGHYQLDFDVFAFEPQHSTCNVGCNSAGGSVTFTIVPELSPALLLASGLAGGSLRRKPRRRPAAFETQASLTAPGQPEPLRSNAEAGYPPPPVARSGQG